MSNFAAQTVWWFLIRSTGTIIAEIIIIKTQIRK